MLRSKVVTRNLAHLTVLLLLTASALACSDGNDGSQSAEEAGAGDGGGAGSGASDDGGAGVNGADTTPPTVTASYPVAGAEHEAVAGVISATFSEPMAPLTLQSAGFGLKQGTVIIQGKVSYFDRTVSFVPDGDLALNTEYTATVTTAATDLAGNPLAASYRFSFTTDATAPVGPAPVPLAAAGAFAILAKAAITNVPTSAITGDVGLSPAAASYITGFALTKAGTKWTSPQVVGAVFAADNDPPTPSNLTTAVSDMETAYTDAAGRSTPTALNLSAGTIGGLTLAPGLYKWTSAVTIPTDLTIAGKRNDTWIFQISGDLSMSSATRMTLTGGARAKNIVWQVAGLVNLGTGAHAEGVMLSKTAIKLGTGASINGRLLAQTAVNLAAATVTQPAP